MPARARKSKKSGPGSSIPQDDAFLRAVTRLMGWATANRTAVTAGAVLLVLVAAGGLYYVNYRQGLEERAATRLQEIQATLQSGQASQQPVTTLQRYVDRFSGTRPAREARLLLARLHLQNGNPEQALRSLEPLSDAPPDTPTGYTVGLLRAAAHRDAGDRERALAIYSELAEKSRFAFQRHEAADRKARILIEAGRLQEALRIYRRLTEKTSEQEGTGRYAVRLGEVRAMLQARGGE